jgi:class 3 adenylate cyclase
VHVSDAVCDRLAGKFRFEARGVVELKGRGPMSTHFLLPLE